MSQKNAIRLIWSHGKDSGSWGTKSKLLAAVADEFEQTLEAVDYKGVMDPDERVSMLEKYCKGDERPLVLIGSSMGGYVSLAASRTLPVQSIFALAPALYLPGYHWQDFPWLKTPTIIVHGWRDELVPVENIIRFSRVHRCTTHLLDSEHRLSSHQQWISKQFGMFLQQCLRGV